MALQYAEERYIASGKSLPPLPEPVREQEGQIRLSTDRLVAEILRRRLAGGDPDQLAYWFHQELSHQIVEACVLGREKTGVSTVALSGGVFQNTLLLGLTAKRLREKGFGVLTHQLIPPNDGGIGLGQALFAMEKINQTKK